MRIFVRLLVLVSLSVLTVVTAFAQGTGTTSSLSGTVISSGKPITGVTVSIASPSLQGTRTTITGDGGGYSFPSLPPGEYTVTMTLEGMEPVTKKVTLQLSSSKRADGEMRLGGVSEAITVTASAPAVLESTQVARNFSQKQIEQLPVRRNIRDTVLLAPGVTANGPNNQIMLSGGPSYDNLFLVNGVVVNENLRGQPHNLFIEDAIQETTVITGSVSAEFGRFTGGVVSTLTKSGGNEFTGSLRDSLTNPTWASKTAFATEADHPDKLSGIYEGTLGGYMMKDRIWFFGAGRHTTGAPQNGFNALVSTVAAPNFGGIQFLNTIDEDRFEGKLTGNVTQAHTLVASYLKVKTIENNNFFAPIYDAPSIVTQRQLPNTLASLAYTGILTSSFILEGAASQKKFSFINSGGIYKDDRIRGTWIQDSNARFNAPVFCGVCTPEGRNNDSGSVKGHYYLNTRNVGNHDIVVGGEMYKETRLVNNNQSASNFTVTSIGTATFFAGDATPYPHFAPNSGVCNATANCGTIFYRPILATSTGSHLNTKSVYFNDKWSIGSRWNLNLGIRYDKNHALDASGNLVSDDSNISPRLGATWDLTGNGRTRLSLNLARYVSKVTDGNAGGAGNAAGTPASFAWAYQGAPINALGADGKIIGTPVSPQDALRTMFAWLDAHCDTNGKCGIQATDFLSSSYPGYTTRVPNSIKSPSVDEVTLGFGKQLGSNFFAKIDVIDRKWHDFYALQITQATGQITAPNGTINDLAILVNDDSSIKRTYQAAQFDFVWNPHRWSFGGGYTYSKLRGNDTSEADGTATSPLTPYNIYYPEFLNYSNRLPIGYLLADQTHHARVFASYALPTPVGNFNVSAIQSADTGRPYSASGTIAIAPGAYTGAPVKPAYYTLSQLGATNTYFFSGRGAFRTPSVFSTDLAMTYELPISHAQLFIQGQIINVFNSSRVNNLVSGQFDTTIRTSRTSGAGLVAFNPFTATPIECPQGNTAAQCTALGANWQKGPLFGQGLSKDAFQTPLTYRGSVGVRF